MKPKRLSRVLAYRKLGDSILFLEKAPKNLFDSSVAPRPVAPEIRGKDQGFSTADTFAAEADESVETTTLFVKNLNFTTSNETFLEVFRPLDGFVTGRIKTKPDPKRPGQTLSMGFGFAEFRDQGSSPSSSGSYERLQAGPARACHSGFSQGQGCCRGTETRRHREEDCRTAGPRSSSRTCRSRPQRRKFGPCSGPTDNFGQCVFLKSSIGQLVVSVLQTL